MATNPTSIGSEDDKRQVKCTKKCAKATRRTMVGEHVRTINPFESYSVLLPTREGLRQTDKWSDIYQSTQNSNLKRIYTKHMWGLKLLL